MALNGGKSARYTAVLVFYVQAQGLHSGALASQQGRGKHYYVWGREKKKYFLLCVVENYR